MGDRTQGRWVTGGWVVAVSRDGGALRCCFLFVVFGFAARGGQEMGDRWAGLVPVRRIGTASRGNAASCSCLFALQRAPAARGAVRGADSRWVIAGPSLRRSRGSELRRKGDAASCSCLFALQRAPAARVAVRKRTAVGDSKAELRRPSNWNYVAKAMLFLFRASPLCSARPRRAAPSALRTANGRFGEGWARRPSPSNPTTQGAQAPCSLRQNKKGSRWEPVLFWRRGWDSNPRYGHPYA